MTSKHDTLVTFQTVPMSVLFKRRPGRSKDPPTLAAVWRVCSRKSFIRSKFVNKQHDQPLASCPILHIQYIYIAYVISDSCTVTPPLIRTPETRHSIFTLLSFSEGIAACYDHLRNLRDLIIKEMSLKNA
jgi:hypothetical protein